MKLIYASASPFVRKVMVVLHETQQVDDVEIVEVKTSPLAPAEGLSATNPLNKIPALERPDGPALYDSRVICAFLNARAEGTLYGRSWDSQVMEATGDGLSDAAVAMAYEKRLRPEGMVWEDWLESQRSKILSGCAALNTRWMSHLHGPLDIGQISIACALSYTDFRHPDAGWRQGNDALAAWFSEFESRPAMQATKPA